jgi:hypothetical protein
VIFPIRLWNLEIEYEPAPAPPPMSAFAHPNDLRRFSGIIPGREYAALPQPGRAWQLSGGYDELAMPEGWRQQGDPSDDNQLAGMGQPRGRHMEFVVQLIAWTDGSLYSAAVVPSRIPRKSGMRATIACQTCRKGDHHLWQV